MSSEFEYEFLESLERLNHIPYHRSDLLLEVEQELYGKLQQVPEDISGLIVLLKNQQMQGNADKARALAHKIWKIGGKISPYMEHIYTELLLSLGMLDMGLTILQPRFSDLHNNQDLFGETFGKICFIICAWFSNISFKVYGRKEFPDIRFRNSLKEKPLRL